MFVDEKKTRSLLFALNHLSLSKSNAFSAALRWLDPTKTYLVEDVTMDADGWICLQLLRNVERP